MTRAASRRASLVGKEYQYIQQAIDAMHISGNGLFTRKCHAILEQILGVPEMLLTFGSLATQSFHETKDITAASMVY